MSRRLRGQKACKAALLEEDEATFLPLPPTRFDACRKASTTVNRLSLVRFDNNDYSVPVRYAHHTVVAKGYSETVLIFRKEECIAEHERIWLKRRYFFQPHPLPQVASIQTWCTRSCQAAA